MKEIYKSLLENIKSEFNHKTFIIPSFTGNYLFRTNKINYFHEKRKVNHGAFVNTILQNESFFRTLHPTNSFTILGKNAEKYSKIFDREKSFMSFFDYFDLNKINLVSINYHAFPATHYAEYKLGLSKKVLANGLVGSYFVEKNKLKWFKNKELHGCDDGFRKINSYYKEIKSYKFEKLNKGFIHSIKFNDAYKANLNILKIDPKFSLCKKSDCFYCRGLLTYNKNDWYRFYKKNFINILTYLISMKNKSIKSQFY